MVVSSGICLLLNTLVIIVGSIYFVFLRIKKEETYSIVIRVICAFALIVINVCKIPINISMKESYIGAIVMIVIGIVYLVVSSIQLGESIYTT